MLKTEYAVPHQVYFDAKHYVEHKRIPFFDIYRNSAFGFVRTTERGGHYTHLVVTEEGMLDCHCKCTEADHDEVCGHGFALYLKMLNWPFEKVNLAKAFDQDPFIAFIKTVGRSSYSKPVGESTNPWISLPEGVLDGRLAHYLGFHVAPEPSKLTQRDLQCLEKAKRLTRTKQEKDMVKKGFPPARVLFEESRLYAVCKLLFTLEQTAGLHLKVTLEAEHQVRITATFESKDVFGWTMPVGTWLKGVNNKWDFWEPLCDFTVRRNALALQYRISFTESNDLEIEPMVEVAAHEFVPVSSVTVPGNRNLYYHELAGYFRIQAGLSPFEMEYSDPSTHKVNHQQVKRFLKDHGETLKTMDRSLIDEALFGEVVVEHFHSLELNLLDFKDARFHYTLSAKLASNVFGDEELRDLFAGSGRYRKLAGKLFDAAGYDGVYLKPVYEVEGEPTLTVSELFRLMTFFRERLQVQTTKLTKDVFANMQKFTMPEVPSLEHTNLQLRDYQKQGYHWLSYLKYYGLGGLLCDQMGLGKTHQSMALMAGTLAENPHARMLVVAPASVVYHWREKLKAFCPQIRTRVHHGPERDARKAMRHFQVVITTFATLRNDIEEFNDHIFDLVVFDEIQNLKNKSTKAYREIKKLQALCKIGLTGTPIENHVKELKALLDLVFPGFLGSDAHFKRYFSDPIDNDSTSIKAHLKEMINPFTLRRNKIEVLSELPEKTEDVRSIEHTDYEKDLYSELKASGKKRLKNTSDGSGMLPIFALIDQLKQVCNHPALYFKNDAYHDYPCAKWDSFTELATEVLQGGEKLVVFTQYLGMVDIFKKYFQQQGVEYACITGQTRHRDKEQERFQTDPNCKVFIGTLRAAGVGIDLTAATVLVHYDRWWNAAREEQGTDRIHRIGQNRAVQVYKFRTLGTVEERIAAIIERKRDLLDEVVAFDSDSFSKVFSIDELLEILA